MTEQSQTNQPQVRGIGLFADLEPLEAAINQLKSASFNLSQVSVVARGIEKSPEAGDVQALDTIGGQPVQSSTGIVTDAVRSATWGSLLVGLTSLAIPGLGAVVAAGSVGVALLTGLAGTGLGLANFNRLVQGFDELGVPEADAKRYSERLSSGDFLVVVEGTAVEVEQAEAAMTQNNIQNWAVYPARTAEPTESIEPAEPGQPEVTQ